MLLPTLVFGPMLMALASYLAGRRSKPARTVLCALTGIAAFGLSLLLWRGESVWSWDGFCGMGLHLRADGFRSLYCAVASFMWMQTWLFSPAYFAHDHNPGRYTFFNLVTLGATLGVFLSDDLYTTLIFFEIMSLTSYTWVAHEETLGAMRAAGTYLAVAIIGGLTTLMGLFILWHKLGTLSFDGLQAAMADRQNEPALVAATWLTLFGFAAKAGMFPLHIWLPKAHPVAPAPASALLSGILTKTGVFGLIVVASRLQAGNASFGRLLLVFAVCTMFLGAVLALFSVDLKRTLACSSASQIGFIAVGISMMTLLGEEGSLAAYGALEHMMNHSLIKLCLFMCAGVVYLNLHKLNLNDIRGFGRNKVMLHICFLLGAISIGCIPPLGSGFNSKSLIHEAILEYIGHLQAHGQPWGIYKAMELLFLFSGGLTIAYMTKLYICLFWEKHPTLQEPYDSMRKDYLIWPASGALLVSALVLPALGLFGAQLMTPCAERSMAFFGQEPLTHAIHYFSAENLIGAAESAAIGAAVYLLVVRRWLMVKTSDGKRVYVDRWPGWLDLEELVYRPLLRILADGSAVVCGFVASIPDCRLIRQWIPAGVTAVTRFLSGIPDCRLIRRWIPDAVTAVTRKVSELPDGKAVRSWIPQAVTGVTRAVAETPERIALFLRESVFAKNSRSQRLPTPLGARLTWRCGLAMNRLARGLNATILRRHPMRTDFEYVLDAFRRAASSAITKATQSVSFGLLLLCIGLLATCIYLLLQ